MKCLKALKTTKEVELGEIVRVDNKTAHNMVGSSWAYVSKSEWKLATRKSKSDNDKPTDQGEKKPNHKEQKSEKNKNK